MAYPHRCLILVAVSSPAQAGRRAGDARPEERYSIENQLRTCRQAVIAHPAWHTVREVTIPGHSRYKYHSLDSLRQGCPEYAEAMALIEAGEADLLVVPFDDRAARTMELGGDLVEFVVAHGCQIYDCSDPQEPVPPQELHQLRAIDKLRWYIKWFAAESDQEKRQEKIYPNLRSRVADRGLPILGHIPYGYARNGSDVPLQLRAEAAWVCWMRDRRLERWAYGRIARGLNEMGIRNKQGRFWSRVAIREILGNDFYAGAVRWGSAEGQGRHEPVFTEAEWAELQAVNRLLRGDTSSQRAEHELTGLCRCAICGHHMVYTRPRPSYGRLICALRCGTYHLYGDGHDPAFPRHHNWHPEPEVLAWLIRQVQQELSDPEAFIALRRRELGESNGQSLQAIDEQLRRRAAEIARWNAAYEGGAIDLHELRDHRRRLGEAIARLREERRGIVDLEARRQNVGAGIRELDQGGKLQELLAALPELESQDRRAIWLRLRFRIHLAPGQKRRIDWRP